MRKIKLTLLLSCMVVAGGFGSVRVSRAQAESGSVAPKATPTQEAPKTQKSPARTSQEGRSGIFSRIHLADLVATLIYSLLGLLVALIGYKAYDVITPFDLRKELEVDQNTSLGIVVGSIILGLCIIIAASIMSP